MTDFVQGQEVRVRLTRQPFMDEFTIHLPNGHTEELDPDETRQWFYDHGVSKKSSEALEKLLDECWNFYESAVTIESYREPVKPFPGYQPQV